jgi:hypothetical protein
LPKLQIFSSGTAMPVRLVLFQDCQRIDGSSSTNSQAGTCRTTLPRVIAGRKYIEGTIRMRTQSLRGVKRFFKLFTESTFEKSAAAAYKFAKRQRKKEFMLLHSLYFLSSSSRRCFVANSPLLVMLQCINPNELFEETVESNSTPPLGQSSLSTILPMCHPCKTAC